MKNSEVIDRVKSLYNEKNVSQENKVLNNRQIFNKLITTRAKIINQEINRFSTLSSECYQSLLVNLNYGGTPFDINTKILKSVNKIPSIISQRNKPIISSVTNINNSVKLYPTTTENSNYVNHNKYTNNELYYYFSNEYLYVKNSTTLQSIVINAIFFNPLDIITDDNFLNSKFPLDGNLIDTVVLLTLQELLAIYGNNAPKENTEERSDES